MLLGQSMHLPLHAPSLSQPSASVAALRLSLMATVLCSQLASAAKLPLLLLLRQRTRSRSAALPCWDKAATWPRLCQLQRVCSVRGHGTLACCMHSMQHA